MNTSLRILVDDTPSDGLSSEHGLSIYIEAGGLNILFDTGQSERFAENAEKLGIDLAAVDFAVVSHGHYDHGNGLPAFFRRNTGAPVYIHPEAAEPVYFSRNGTSGDRYVGIDQNAADSGRNRFVPVTGLVRPAERILLVPCSLIEDRKPVKNDASLFIRRNNTETEETFDHEIFMVAEGDRDYLVISGCSHNNIVSIIEHCKRLFPAKTLKAVIGGFHMPGDTLSEPEYLASVEKTARRLASVSDEVKRRMHIQHPLYITGHCTGRAAGLLLKSKLKDNIDFFHTGSRFLL